MTKHLFLLGSLGALLSGCALQETMQAMQCNTQAIEWSTCAVLENAEAIEAANAAIEDNRKQIDALNKRLQDMNKE